jgi:molybdopterin synthase catalytic subunit
MTDVTAPGPVRLVAVRETALSVDEVLASVRADGAGGLVLFVGTVREVDGGRSVVRLDYSAHPNAEAAMRTVAEAVAARFPVLGLAAVHRVGDLSVGDAAVIVAAACPHRAEAFEAARALIDEVKATVPIWKHQVFADGDEEWVGSP